MNQRLDVVMETYLSCLEGYIDDVLDFGFISDREVLKENQTKINIHYFKKEYTDKIIEAMAKYFETKYFRDPNNDKQKMTGFIVLTGSLGNHANWEPRLLNAMRQSVEKKGLLYQVVYQSDKNEQHGGGILIQFLRPGIKKL